MNWGPRRSLALLMLALGAAVAGWVRGEVYQEPDAFVAEVFGTRPEPKVLWLTKDIQAQAAAILGHPRCNCGSATGATRTRVCGSWRRSARRNSLPRVSSWPMDASI